MVDQMIVVILGFNLQEMAGISELVLSLRAQVFMQEENLCKSFPGQRRY